MNLETLIQKRQTAIEEFNACQKRLQELIQSHANTVKELDQRHGQVVTLNDLVAELSPKPEQLESTPLQELELVKSPT